MTQDHPIRPPHELVQQWVSLACENEGYETWQDLATQAARWGADQELEAVLTWLRVHHFDSRADALLAARRPKPSSLKDQALAVLDHTPKGWGLAEVDLDTIRRALEALPD